MTKIAFNILTNIIFIVGFLLLISTLYYMRIESLNMKTQYLSDEVTATFFFRSLVAFLLMGIGLVKRNF